LPKKRTVFLALVLAASCVLALLAFILLKPEEADTAVVEAPPAEYILQLEGIKSVTVKNAEGEFTVFPGEEAEGADAAQGGAVPFIGGFEDCVMPAWDLARMLDMPAGLVSRGLVDEAPPERASFGLDPPRAEVRVETESGQAVLYIGNDAPDGSNIYMAKEGDSGVYLADSWSLGNYFKRALDFVDLAVTPAPVDDGAGAFVCDTIRLGGLVRRGEEITVLKEDREAGVSTQAGLMASPFRLTSPFEFPFSLDKGLPALQGIFGIRASRAVAKDTDPASYGLAEPWSTVSVNGTLEKGMGGFAVRVSRPDSSGNVYLMKEGSGVVFEAAASALPWLSVSWFDLMEKLITLPYIDSVAAVEVRTPERTVEFALSGEKDDLKVRAGGVDMDVSVFRSYYQTLLTASYEDRTDISPASLPAPFLEIVYRYREAKDPEHIRFYSTGSRRVLVNYNGGRVFSTYSAYTGKVIADLDQVLAGQKVLPYL
jgi:hypothetical protein